MKEINLIVAHDINNVIGYKNEMPWGHNLKLDLKRVKELTTNQTIVMGRKTYESLGKPLPNRLNVILSSKTKEELGKNYLYNNVKIINSIDDIFNLPNKVFIFGGSELYKQCLNMTTNLYITKVHYEFKGDTYFPEYNIENYDLINSEKVYEYPYCYEFLDLKRK